MLQFQEPVDFNEYATDPPEPIRNVRQRIGELQEVGQDEGMVEAAADRLLMEEPRPTTWSKNKTNNLLQLLGLIGGMQTVWDKAA